ncbi:oxygenase MpaB family protein [Polyangium sp. 15x6]|uniref:oxygenase MpaB family protein n=1 Tax=Polyangium sp. 15x6 TaxID=3042687 RepID=UPI00249C4B1D|nr:oxygenase MpaB family protein [Polyangium sp. 15x6]MDI3289927.1 oxygenase MpaB family protein [Polyangium sp. 15x6]
MQGDHPRGRILANIAKPAGSFWKTSKLTARILIGRQAEPTQEQYEQFVDLMFEGDPLGDAVAAWMLKEGVGRSMKTFDHALRHGIASIESPPEPLRTLFEQVDRRPLWLDKQMLLAGQRAAQRAGALMPYILGDLALVGGYVTMGAMNKSLVATGALAPGGSARRLYETLCWWLDVTGDHGLERYAPGFISTVKVRVMHALVRIRLSRDPSWRFEAWGAPLSQAHLATTNQAFASAYITLARGFGVRYSASEIESIMHLFRYAGLLMGVREEYCCATVREGFRLITMSHATSPPPDEDAVKLAEGYFEGGLDFRTRMPKWPPMQTLGGALSRLFLQSRIGTLRALLGEHDADLLKIPPAGISKAFPAVLLGTTLAAQAATSFLPDARALQARIGRRIQLGIKEMSPLGGEGPISYQPYEHREGAERRAMRPHAVRAAPQSSQR